MLDLLGKQLGLVLCFSDAQAAGQFRSGSRAWAAQALYDLGISFRTVDLPPGLRQALIATQKRQYR
jgi:hypothetical protein